MKIQKVLFGILISLGLISLISGLPAILLGPAAIPGIELVDPSVDNEFRFLATPWVMFGIFCFWVSLNLEQRLHFVPMICLVPLIGGAARMLSYFSVGQPVDMYVHAIFIEFLYAAVMYGLYLKLQSHPTNQQEII